MEMAIAQLLYIVNNAYFSSILVTDGRVSFRQYFSVIKVYWFDVVKC